MTDETKLAMTVGDSRHYVIDSIMPRHFLQTAANAAYPRLSIRSGNPGDRPSTAVSIARSVSFSISSRMPWTIRITARALQSVPATRV